MKKQTLQILTLIVTLTSCNITNEEHSNKVQNLNNDFQIVLDEPSYNTNGKIKGKFGGCGYNYTPNEEIIDLYEPRQRELSEINTILKYSGLASNFKIYSASINNAIATIIDNKRYILYDPKMLSNTDGSSGSYWSSMSILAHEIGHHLSGHTITNKGSNPKDELEADKYSGFILYKLGATLEDATYAIRTLGSEKGSSTHPPMSERIKAITQGWNEAYQTQYNSAIPPPPNDQLIYDIYDYNMLINEKNLNVGFMTEEEYANYDFFYGVIKEVSYDKSGNTLETFKVYIKKTGPQWKINVGSLDNETIDIALEEYWDAKNSSQASYKSLSSLITPGRRIKFAFKEGLYGGTAESGWLRLTYIKALKGNTF